MAPKTWAIRRSNGNRYGARAVRYINRRSYVVLRAFPGQTGQPTPFLRRCALSYGVPVCTEYRVRVQLLRTHHLKQVPAEATQALNGLTHMVQLQARPRGTEYSCGRLPGPSSASNTITLRDHQNGLRPAGPSIWPSYETITQRYSSQSPGPRRFMLDALCNAMPERRCSVARLREPQTD
ncbi:hypothetical protein THAR02_09505 [Trichoderma harzianum]|uniref:Uncharacterized protein n=1 Tax=Trichoderma harzianum TaxID=5544 RepID=A0A0F9XCI6_TRIHA|nr:hypothetical protein THAR02_09505 [Trichoderma harzianum]